MQYFAQWTVWNILGSYMPIKALYWSEKELFHGVRCNNYECKDQSLHITIRDSGQIWFQVDECVMF